MVERNRRTPSMHYYELSVIKAACLDWGSCLQWVLTPRVKHCFFHKQEVRPCLGPLFLSEKYTVAVDVESEFISKVSNIDVLVTNDCVQGSTQFLL